NQVASAGIHHVGVTLRRSDAGYELFIPRGFAVSLWELLVETAEQFGLEIV
ncbi:MAG TPA: sarcosine oxidase subunit gamma, partial [Gammaproteobacteria bacterium]|nr:sarcosine oxidase subunit gamma [Gammaproteobacteria bacterium]